MTTAQPRDVYYETGLEALSEIGYPGLKLAEICRRLGVTSGAFYHHFANWSDYTTGLIDYWRDESTTRLLELLAAEPDPVRRLDRIVAIGLSLPHGAESAIRTWSRLDPHVRQVQTEVDRQRFDAVADAVRDVTGDHAFGDRFAHWALYLLVGYEQSTLEPNTFALQQAMMSLIGLLEDHRAAVLRE